MSTGTQVQKYKSVKGMLADPAIKAQIARALPRHMDADRMVRIALSALARTPKLAQCTPESVGIALVKAAEIGVEVNGWEAHLVPFKNKGQMECQLIVDYKGLVKLAYQSDLVLEVHAEVVREGDLFDWAKGTESFLRWKPGSGPSTRPMTHAWAMAKIKNGGSPFVVLTREEVMAHKKCGQGSNSEFSPWNRPETEPAMWKKTAVRDLCKMLPRSSALTQLLIHEQAVEIGGDVIDGVMVQPSYIEEAEQGESKADAIARQIGSGKEPKQPPEEPAKKPPAKKPAPKPEPPQQQAPPPPAHGNAPAFYKESFEKMRACTSVSQIDEVWGAICQDPRSSGELTQEQQEMLFIDFQAMRDAMERQDAG